MDVTGLDLLAEAASSIDIPTSVVDGIDDTPEYVSKRSGPSTSTAISPALSEALVFSRASASVKPVCRTLLSQLPDNLTYTECIRTMSLKQLEKVKTFAEREKKAKSVFLKKKTISKTLSSIRCNQNEKNNLH